MIRALALATLAFAASGCGGMVNTKSFFDLSSGLPPFFSEVSASHHDGAYELLCPPIKSAIEYGAFEAAMSAHPYLRSNSGFSTSKSYGLLGSGVATYTGWLTSVHGAVPAEMSVDARMKPCVLGVTVLGASVLPPFRAPSPHGDDKPGGARAR